MRAIDLKLDLPLTGDLAGNPTTILRRLVARWSPEVFLPMECRATVSGEPFYWPLSAAPELDAAPWPGETVAQQPVTKLDGHTALKPDVFEQLPAGDRYAVQLIGGLRFVEPDLSAEPAWYGRVTAEDAAGQPPILLTLAYVSFHWQANWREIRMRFPMLGYPLSGQLPRFDDKGRPVGQQPADVVERNRRSVIGAFSHCASALGFEPAQVSWSVETEEGTPAAVHEAIAALLQEATGRK
ncbi:hypothetical protein LMG28688_06246 [Paraburkholderia caffeinitolerans]|uniref:Uncharacterized protein n=1 Tax=Paraburkholderia caffeinitolerans TaxID=1723730 RepID=A0A6J5GTA8_9BURK|nr:hypothetical protein [Paraburkholderia caffeinitolerans]CAB3805748.1 hypothetical protein LMG28688_06246 [Paraburkholderia caffeinitolerans]